MDNRDLWLATALVELAESAEIAGGETVIADQITAKPAELLAPAEVGLLLRDEGSAMTLAAASCGRARDLLLFEVRHGEGPASECAALGQPILGESLAAAARRWPGFAAAAGAAGYAVASALPLIRHDQVMGAISVLVAGDRQPADADLRLAEILSHAAAVAVMQHRELAGRARTASQLQHALDSRVLIEQAKGAAAARLGITPEEAFGLIRSYARRASLPLADVARQTISGQLPVGELFGQAAAKAAAAHQSR